jgi:tRNA A58 N-methylase Trm61
VPAVVTSVKKYVVDLVWSGCLEELARRIRSLRSKCSGHLECVGVDASHVEYISSVKLSKNYMYVHQAYVFVAMER